MQADIIKEGNMRKGEHEHGRKVKESWEKSERNPVIIGLKQGKGMPEITAGIGELSKAFGEAPFSLGCSDGRICEHRLGGAGSFILAPEEELEKFIRENKGRIKQVTSHDGCGAAAIKFKELKEAGKLPEGVNTADELGAAFAKNLADRLKAGYYHIPAREMSGEVHNERTVYFDGTGRFNPLALKEMPTGFMCAGPKLGFSREYCRKELAILCGIALGDHGFGERFSEDNPLYIIVSAESAEQLKALEEIAEKAAEEFKGRVAVKGFVAK